MRRLKVDGTASVAELREFLGRMRGRSPQEVLGEVAKSNLVQCTVLAILLTAFAMGAMTLAPYYLQDPKAVAAKAEKEKAKAAKAAEKNAPKTETEPAATAQKAPADGDAPSQSNLEQAAEKMQMNETKVTDPKANPLDKDLDKLLELKD